MAAPKKTYEEKTTRLYITMPRPVKRRLEQHKRLTRIPISQIISMLCEQYFEKLDADNSGQDPLFATRIPKAPEPEKPLYGEEL